MSCSNSTNESESVASSVYTAELSELPMFQNIIQSPLRWSSKHETLISDYVAFCRDNNKNITNHASDELSKLPMFQNISIKKITQKLNLYCQMYISVLYH